MKILFYSHSSTLYGAPMSLVNLISGLKKLDSKIELHVVLPKAGDLENKLQEEKISYSVIPHFKWTYSFPLFSKKKKKNIMLAYAWLYKNSIERTLKNQFYYSAHEKFLKMFKPDLVYVNSTMAPMGCYLANKNNIPLLWHHRETINDPVTGFYLDDNAKFRKVFKKATVHLYPSEFLRDSYGKYYGHHQSKKEKVIYNGVPDKSKTIKPQIRKDSLVSFGMIGRINEQKGQRQVFEIFNNLKSNKYPNDYKLHIFGDGEEGYVNDLKKEYFNEKVIYRGFKNHQTIYNEIDFVIVNAKHESFGRVVAEANAYGVPVIAIRSGALKEIVFEDLNGYSYSSGVDLFQILENLLNRNDITDFYRRLSVSSRECFVQKFSISACSMAVLKEVRNSIDK